MNSPGILSLQIDEAKGKAAIAVSIYSTDENGRIIITNSSTTYMDFLDQIGKLYRDLDRIDKEAWLYFTRGGTYAVPNKP